MLCSALGVSNVKTCFALLAHLASRLSWLTCIDCVVSGAVINRWFRPLILFDRAELDESLSFDRPLWEELLKYPDICFVKQISLVLPITSWGLGNLCIFFCLGQNRRNIAKTVFLQKLAYFLTLKFRIIDFNFWLRWFCRLSYIQSLQSLIFGHELLLQRWSDIPISGISRCKSWCFLLLKSVQKLYSFVVTFSFFSVVKIYLTRHQVASLDLCVLSGLSLEGRSGN